jgi:hypothetical protein
VDIGIRLGVAARTVVRYRKGSGRRALPDDEQVAA